MTDNPTRILNALVALTDNPDDISYTEQNGHPFIVLGGLSLSLAFTSRDALDKFVAVAAQAAVAERARNLRAVI